MKKRHTPEQIVRKLREADEMLSGGSSVTDVGIRLGVSEATTDGGSGTGAWKSGL